MRSKNRAGNGATAERGAQKRTAPAPPRFESLMKPSSKSLMKKPTAAPCGAAVGRFVARGPGEMPDRRSTASSYAVFANDFRSSMLAMAHLVSTSTASPWAFIAISTSSLAWVTALSYSDLAFAI